MWPGRKKNKTDDIQEYIGEIDRESKEYKDIYDKLCTYYSEKNLKPNEIDIEISRLESKETIRANPMYGFATSIVIVIISTIIDIINPQFDTLGNIISYLFRIILILLFSIMIKDMEKHYTNANRKIKFDKVAIQVLKDIKTNESKE